MPAEADPPNRSWRCRIIQAAVLIAATLLAVAVLVGGYFWWKVPNPSWSASALITALESPAPMRDSSRWSVAQAILAKGPEAVRVALPSLIASEIPRIQETVPEALERLGPEGPKVLVSLLAHQDPRVRTSAARWLGKLAGKNTPGFEQWAPALRRALKDSDAGVRQQAREALEILDLLTGPVSLAR